MCGCDVAQPGKNGLGHQSVIPAHTGIQATRQWIPAFAGMTVTDS
jgi:hypothetical protein